MAKQAVDAGAQFIVSPNLDEEVVAHGTRKQVDLYPGVMAPKEIVRAVKAAKAVKVFPNGSLGGAAYLKEIRAPLNHVPVIGFRQCRIAKHSGDSGGRRFRSWDRRKPGE